MTAPHDLTPESSSGTGRRVLKIVGVAALVGMFVAGVISFLPGGFGALTSRVLPAEVEGNIVWTSEDLAIQLGPGGWITHPGEGGDYVARNVRTGESWVVGDLDSGRLLTQDGVVVQDGGEGAILVQREGSTSRTSTQDIVDAVGDEALWPGEDITPIGVSAEHVAVVTCLAPRPARLHEEVRGSHQVVAGIDLTDASIAWTHDTGAACGPSSVWTHTKTLPAQEYVLLEPAEDQLVVLDLDTGKAVKRVSGAKGYWFALQGEHLLESDGDDTVTWSSLRTGREIARVTCAGAGIASSGLTRQIAPEATPYVECRDSVRVLHGTRFVEVDARPVRSGEPIEDGQEVAHGHLVMRREGEVVHVRDALTGRALQDLDVPEDFHFATYVPQGRLIAFVEVHEGRERNSAAYRVFDARTGALVVSTSGGMRTGADASPDGIVLVESDDEDATGTRLWAAATEGER